MDKPLQTPPLPRWTGRHSLLVAAALLLLGTLMASGRISSGDTGEQLRAAQWFARTGSFSGDASVAQVSGLWVRAPSGRYYECHDALSQCILVPAALLARHADPMADRAPLAVRAAAGYTYTLLGVATTWLMYHALCAVYSRRKAFLLALLFCYGTILCAYTKSAWDVAGAALGMTGLLAVLQRTEVAGSLDWRSVVGIAFWTAVACSFRFSLLPFVGLGLLILVVTHRDSWPARRVCATVALFLVLMMPQLISNAVRTGSFWRPATTAPQFDQLNGLNGNMLVGVYGLLVSPNKGVIWNTPAFLLLIFVLPAAGNRLPEALRKVTWPLLIGAAAYICMIGSMRNWGAFGWGARYLVPILPVLFLPLAAIIVDQFTRRPAITALLVALGLISNSPAVFSNWHQALATSPPAQNPLALYPAQQAATWRAAWRAATGAAGLEPSSQTATHANAGFGEFPDLMLARIGEVSANAKIAATIVTAVCILLCVVLIRLALIPADHKSEPADGPPRPGATPAPPSRQ